MSEVIITVHGVGKAKRGATLAALTTVVPRLAGSVAANDLVLGTNAYPRRQPVTPGVVDLVEVNWVDVRKPLHTVCGALKHLSALAVAVLNPDHAWLGFQPALGGLAKLHRWTQNAYRFVLETFALWAVFPVFLTLAYMSLPAAYQTISEVIAAILLAVSAWMMRQWGPWIAWAGRVWLGVMLIFILSIHTNFIGIDNLIYISSWCYGGAQLVSAFLLTVLLIMAIIAAIYDTINWVRYFTYLAMNYIALLTLAIFGSLYWAAVLVIITLINQQFGRPDLSLEWSKIFLGNIGYNLMMVEFAMLGATLCISLLVAVGLVRYFGVYRGIIHSKSTPGQIAMRGYRALLLGMPVFLAIPGVALILTCPIGPFPPNVQDLLDCGIVLIYTISAARVAAFLPRFLPKAAIVLGVIGDVMFYTTRPESDLSIRAICNKRLDALLKYYSAQSSITHICVVSHSQGSVIAYEVLKNFTPPAGTTINYKLVTMGSPISTLYGDFLGLDISAPIPLPGLTWNNLYRDGDYIGGPIPAPPVTKDVSLGHGEHIDYWSDPRIAGHI